MIRNPAVAGQFYPGRASELRSMIQRMVDPRAKKEKALAVVSPHAGFVYSGYVAGAVFSSVVLPGRIVLLGPSHREIRSLFAVSASGTWRTPLGEVPLDLTLARAILDRSPLLKEEDAAHAREHSLEVQLPFIQFLNPEFSIVPVCISYLAGYQELEELGLALAGGIRESGEDVLIVASTDMSHYVSAETAKRKDFMAIEKILNLDARGLYDVVRKEDISMCGFLPTTAAILAAKELGARKAELVRYQTSGDASGDYDQVVGYAGLRIT
jgi:AmmeMemoRadiSam system protein B